MDFLYNGHKLGGRGRERGMSSFFLTFQNNLPKKRKRMDSPSRESVIKTVCLFLEVCSSIRTF